MLYIGPFEMIDYAVALGAEPIITTTMTSTPESFADLVDYCWANTTTAMGRKRVADGHPEPYRLRFIELGNEQYNPQYIDQVIAMEARANEVGAEGQLHYGIILYCVLATLWSKPHRGNGAFLPKLSATANSNVTRCLFC